MLDVIAGADAAVVRVVQKVGDALQRDFETGAMRGLQVGAEMIEQRLDLTPMDVAGRCFVEDAVQEVIVFVAHVFYGWELRNRHARANSGLEVI